MMAHPPAAECKLQDEECDTRQATAIPLLAGLLMARYLFKFHPALSLGCTAGARTTTAALGAIQDAVESDTPALGYTVTYAVGNTLLIIWGVVIVLLM